jgi:hypothetical protein
MNEYTVTLGWRFELPLTEVKGKYGIRAKVLRKTMNRKGVTMVTFEIEYPRMILAELNTHRNLSRNSASSRAIPFTKMLEQLTARPVRFGQANPGMQDKGVDFNGLVGVPRVVNDSDIDWSVTDNYAYSHPFAAWSEAKSHAVEFARVFYEAGYHKQVYNRLVEPFQMMKTVISATEWDNFYWLRDDGAADPTIAELARVMREAHEKAVTVVLKPGQWHLPYLTYGWDEGGDLHYCDNINGEWIVYELQDAIKISCARSAAVSFRNVDYGLEKSREVYERLVGDERKHASAFEHCATPMNEQQGSMLGHVVGTQISGMNIPALPYTWQDGVSHMDREEQLWSGNLRGYVQYRKLIPGENYTQ